MLSKLKRENLQPSLEVLQETTLCLGGGREIADAAAEAIASWNLTSSEISKVLSLCELLGELL